MRLWIDTDVGDNPDDAIAILAARAHPAVDICGISTVFGDTPERARLARALVGEKVVVVAGGHDDVVGAVRDAGPDVLLAIGPLTNVAVMARVGALAPRVVVMGGALGLVSHRGAVRTVEWNFGADPLAAGDVLARALGLVLVPLDVTVAVRADEPALAALQHAEPAILPELMGWLAQAGALVLHDPAALLVATGDVPMQTEARAVRVEPGGRVVPGAGAPVHDVVVDLDAAAVVARVVDLVVGS